MHNIRKIEAFCPLINYDMAILRKRMNNTSSLLLRDASFIAPNQLSHSIEEIPVFTNSSYPQIRYHSVCVERIINASTCLIV